MIEALLANRPDSPAKAFGRGHSSWNPVFSAPILAASRLEEKQVQANERSALRLFLAVDLSDEVRAQVAQHVALLRSHFPSARASWERNEKLHITLKFLGDVDASNIERVTNAAKAAAASCEPFELAIVAPGAFRKRGKPAVLWLGIDDQSGSLAALNARLEDETASAGFPREKRAFSPHLTIARIRVPEKNSDLIEGHLAASFKPAKFTVSELLVVRSDLGPGGSTYTTLSSHPLTGNA